MFDQLPQQLINGISQGSIYALVALGYTMVYGVLRFINFAHGDVFMVGAYAGFFLIPILTPVIQASPILGGLLVVLVAMAACATLGVVLERLAYRPLRSRPKLTVLITAIGVSLFLEYAGQLPFIFGPTPKTFPELVPSGRAWHIAGIVISTTQIMVLTVSLVLMALLRLIVMRTRMGMAMRAVSTNQTAASLMGVNLDNVISFTFALGSSMAAAAGILYASMYPKIDPLMGILPGLKAFVAAVLGGIGSIPGALVGGLIIGIVETMTTAFLSSTYRDAIVFAILIAILVFRPTGLFGRSVTEKV
jgi:branched-chain amino acid transport system permease protein